MRNIAAPRDACGIYIYRVQGPGGFLDRITSVLSFIDVMYVIDYNYNTPS